MPEKHIDEALKVIRRSNIQAEQELGRLKKEAQPFIIPSALLGPCYQYVFVQYFDGSDPFPISSTKFVRGLVETLLSGIAQPDDGSPLQ